MKAIVQSTRPLLIAGGALVVGVGVAIASITMAAYNDQANLNLGENGIGFADRFDIGVVLPDGTVEQADDPDGTNWVVTGADTLAPGHSVTTSIPVFNNTTTLNADTTFEIVLMNSDGSVNASTPNITPHLRFTAEIDGTTVFSDVAWSDAHGVLGELAARDDAALAEGDLYTAGADDSEQSLSLTITYLDEPGVEALNGGQAALSVRFNAQSVKP